MKHLLPELPYALDALEPAMSRETFEFHYGKHLQTYIDNLNRLIQGTPFEDFSLEEIIMKADGGILNNAAQTWNHTFFTQFTQTAVSLFGSGWAWLVSDGDGRLSISAEPNAGNPMRKGLRPLLTVDVWEHAYYIDYRNRRADYLNAWWSLVDWKAVDGLLG